jgi:3-oxoacyl-[acyl-carrier protein] reductase
LNLGLENQVAFVAGSSRGIGRAIAEALLSEGARVVLTGRDPRSLDEARALLVNVDNHDRVLTISADLSKAADIAAAIERAAQHFGAIHHLVASLGTGKGSSNWDQPESEWQRSFEDNFFASVRLTQAVLPRLLSNPDGGSILYISSIVAVEATAAPLPYCAAKAALVNYSKNLARRIGSQKVRVNAIAPGNILFPGGSWQDRLDKNPGGVSAILASEVPQQRFGTSAEVASLAAYLCSERAGFCTGACYVVDGGQTRSL